MKLVQRFQKHFKAKEEETQTLPTNPWAQLSPVFGKYTITDEEKGSLKKLLEKYTDNDETLEADFASLSLLTAEVKAINNQAALLHGERIKKAQEILKNYREGAFTSWLIETYGNRQTPYNFLQYHEFHQAVPAQLHAQMDTMPRQAIYTLASRNAALKDKQAFIENYRGQTKEELLTEIRRSFPLKENDGRKQNVSEMWLKLLERTHASLESSKPQFSSRQKQRITSLLKGIHDLL